MQRQDTSAHLIKTTHLCKPLLGTTRVPLHSRISDLTPGLRLKTYATTSPVFLIKNRKLQLQDAQDFEQKALTATNRLFDLRLGLRANTTVFS